MFADSANRKGRMEFFEKSEKKKKKTCANPFFFFFSLFFVVLPSHTPVPKCGNADTDGWVAWGGPVDACQVRDGRGTRCTCGVEGDKKMKENC
jgi:hypothetical protein